MGTGDGRLAGDPKGKPIEVVCKKCGFKNVFTTHYRDTCGNPRVAKHSIKRK
jgi:hypothetical protein